ncbi:MAG: 30S ribosomal protein S9 [bacterium]|nr:30S ribosomal protein S9 [bacterium]
MPEGKYTYAVGRRKESVAQVRLYSGTGKMTVNDQQYQAYFSRFDLQEALRAPLKAVGKLEMVDVWARVRGGGIRGQAEAVRLGISRALILEEPTFRATLKPLDFLRRDPRKKERKKYGLKKARKRSQWAKR